MHSHPASMVIFLTENRARFTFPDGKSEERYWEAGPEHVHSGRRALAGKSDPQAAGAHLDRIENVTRHTVTAE
jgi:hypothetical protein